MHEAQETLSPSEHCFVTVHLSTSRAQSKYNVSHFIKGCNRAFNKLIKHATYSTALQSFCP